MNFLLGMVTIGTKTRLSFIYKNLKANEAKKAVAEYFGINYRILESWMEHLGYIRNICAHHSRLWNRTLTIKPTLPGIIKDRWINTSAIRTDKVNISFAIMEYLIQKITSESHLVGKSRAMIERFSEFDLRSAGFYKRWENDEFWKKIPIPLTYKAKIAYYRITHKAA